MKVLALILVFACAILYSKETKSQAVVVMNSRMVFTDGDGVIFNSIRSKTVTLPSGFILKTASFQLPEDHPLVPKKSTRIIGIRFILSYEMDENNEPLLDEDGNMIPKEFITDEKADINHKGKFNVTLHLNGAGNYLPIGWYNPSYYE